MDEIYRSLAQHGTWVEIGIIAAMVAVALISLKLMVSLTVRFVVFIVAIALIGGGFFFLHGIRKERRWVSFRIEYRGRIRSSRGFGLKKRTRCTLIVKGRFRHFKYHRYIKANEKNPTQKTTHKSSPSKSSSGKAKGKNPKKSSTSKKPSPLSGIRSKCRLVLKCGNTLEKEFGPQGTCEYFHEKGRITYSSRKEAQETIEIKDNRARITVKTPKSQKRLLLRVHRTQAKRPVF